ncbi:MAG: hypothetical protein K6T30_06190 [Alicyclobacillus sp.]|nr:hypothetical protein [Alicyclobacillus sp.]
MKLLLLLFMALLAGVAVVITRAQRTARTRRTGSVPPGFQPTDEVVVDPTTRVRQRVWYHPLTGQRIYCPEDPADGE